MKNKKTLFINIVFKFLQILTLMNLLIIFITIKYIKILKINTANNEKYILFLNIMIILELIQFLLIEIAFNYKIKKQKDINFDIEETNKRLEKCYDGLRSFKHDFANIMQSMGGYIEIGDLKGLKKMYLSIIKESDEITNIKGINKNQINNPAIYHLINKKYAVASKNGIKMKVESLIDLNKLNISDFEICRMLGIFIDNAIEATEECENKYITIKFIYDRINNRDLIIIENPCKNYLININKLYEKNFSTKKNKNGHGLGLWKAQQIAKNNKNIEIFTQRDYDFKQAISIKLA